MDVYDFLEKFTPDDCKNQVIRQNRSNSYIPEDLIQMFDYALDGFAERICKKQRENCANSIGMTDTFGQNHTSILTAEQPKIEEL